MRSHNVAHPLLILLGFYLHQPSGTGTHVVLICGKVSSGKSQGNTWAHRTRSDCKALVTPEQAAGVHTAAGEHAETEILDQLPNLASTSPAFARFSPSSLITNW